MTDRPSRPGGPRAAGVAAPACLLALAFAGNAAIAQPSPAQPREPTESEPTEAADEDPVETIYVVARGRPERLEATPIAITRFGAEEIESRSAVGVGDLINVVPNAVSDPSAAISGSANSPAVFIRGIGQTDFVFSTDPGVAVYLDGVYLARSTGSALDVVDIDRVQVLRGPQGTFFGRNTIGGAITVDSAAPMLGETHARTEVAAGNFDRFDVRGMVNLPIGTRAAARFAGAWRHEDGEGRRLLAGGTLGGQEATYARGRLRWRPEARVTVDLSADYTSRNDESPVSALTAVGGPAAIGAPGTLFTGLLYNNLIRGPDGLAPCERPGFAFPFCGLPGLIQLPTLPASTIPFDSRWLTGNLFDSLGTGPTGSEFEGGGAAVIVEFEAPVIIRSISAYRRFRAAFGRDPDNAPLVMIDTANRLTHEQLSQELRLTQDGARFDWIAGLYYFQEEGTDRVTAPFVEETFSIINRLGLGCTLLPGVTGLPNPIFLPACPNIFRIDSAGDGTRVENRSIAAYGEVILQVADWLSVSGGLRWTRDRKSIDISGFLVGGVPVSPNPIARRTFSRLTPRVIIQAEPHPGSMAYASWSTGFKSGGFNQRYGAPIAEPTSFEPETVRNYELGFRLWRPRERVRIAVTGFWSDYRDIQAVVFDGGIPRTINAAQGRSRGIEIEASWAPLPALTLAASYGWLDARFTRLDPAIIGSFGTPIVNPLQLDNRFVNSPRHSLTLSTAYVHEGGRAGRFSIRSDVSHRSSIANDAVNTPELIQGPVTLVNARLSWSSPGGNWSASLFGTNLLDEVYVISGAADPAGFGAAEINAAPTRRWGASVQFTF